MRCPRCHTESREGRRFCGECGLSLASACPACGFRNEGGERFCGGCGSRLVSPPSIPESQFGTPESYTPRHLAERILTSKASLEGERKQVTVLFADLKGSMELLADRDPEEARKLLDPVLERMMEAVHHYEGTVNQVMGDGIMALFGAPLTHEDHALRACHAALRMQDAIHRYREDLQGSHGMEVQIRVGLNSGDVVVRAIGNDLRMDYTAVGQTTHLAARMEQLAAPGTILLAPATRQLVEGYVQVEAGSPVSIKGLADPVIVYTLTGASAQRTRLQATAVRGLTRFVGRETEIEQIRGAFALARDGHGQIVALVGEPGVGKSRFLYELTHSDGIQAWLTLEAASVSYGKGSSYLPVIDLLKGYFKLHERDSHHEIREKVTARLRSLDHALGSILPALLALLDVPVEDASWKGLDPPQRRQRILEAVKLLLLRESREQPVLLVFEDLHWIDAETQALLDGLVEGLPAARLLLLVSYRPGYHDGWVGKACHGQVRLDALPPASTGKLLSALLGEEPGLEPLKRLLVKRGNPFFIEESIRTLVETHALAGERGAHRLIRPIETIEVPSTVQVILAARIDRLPEADKQLLQTAAVIGKDVSLALLHAVAERPEDAVQQGLRRLQAADFLHEKRPAPDVEYTFKHALTHEVTYGTLLQKRRRMLHARIVGAIEPGYPDRLIEHVERLAHHAVRGELWEKAVGYLRQAGAKALTRSANREAVGCFDQALAALGRLPEARETLEQAVDLRFGLRTALFPLGEFERVLACLREAEGLARTLDDQRRLAQVSVSMCQHLYVISRPGEALGFGESARTIAESLQDVPLQVTGNLYLGVACLATGDYRQAELLLGKVLQLLDGDRSRERFGLPGFPAVMARAYLTWILADLGRFEEGIVHVEDGILRAETLGHPYSLASGCWILAYLHIVRGKLDGALGLLERGLALSREWTLTFYSVLNTASLGYVRALSGQIAEGLPLLEQALRALESMGLRLFQPLVLVYLGEAYVLADRLDDAHDCATRALALAREGGQRGHEAWALRLLGEVAAAHEPPERATDHYRDALALAAELGMSPLVAHCHLGLGNQYRRTGGSQQAREHLETATTMYRDMGMPLWLTKAGHETETPG